MFQTVIFDYDMTLVDSLYAITRGLNKMAVHFGLPTVDEEDTRRVMSLDPNDFWRNLWGYYDEAWNDYFVAEVNGEEAVHLKIASGAEELLAKLKSEGRSIGLATNRYNAWGALTAIGLAMYFDAAVGSDEVPRGKPSPDVLLVAISKLKADPATTLYVGDAKVDMQAAAAAGIRGVGLLTGGVSKEELTEAGAWQVRHDIQDLSRLFQALP